ncbi:hypothetical protein GN958_ATG08367 [Phytophthora infestans]|uniref:RxLR effector protein n=1 Tax=Phytophthora infestans TaxID=4787 RepID=A0A8S9UTR7_PHYIN|nr:hypothetical protein GN958_ATG08367 [Phytophthora infestans]
MTRLYLLILAALAIFSDPSAAFGVAKMGVIKSTSDHLKAESDSTTSVKSSVNAPGSQVDDERTLSAYLSTLDDAIKRSKAVDNVFRVLNLNRASDDLLTNANWVSWEKYVEELFPKNFKDEVLVKTLREHYDDQHILQMLAKAKENPRTKEIATALEKQLINIPLVMLTSWKGRNLGPGHVFKVFPVKDSSQLDDLVRDKKWGFWIKYVDGITPDADKVSRILNPLINRFTTEGVVKTIASDSVVDTKYLEELLLAKWLGDSKTKSKTVDKVRGGVLKAVFPDKLPEKAEDLVARYTAKAVKESRDVDDLFRVLGLNSKLDDLLTHPSLVAWMKRMDDVYSTTDQRSIAMAETLMRYYDDRHLLEMLAKAKKSQSTKEIATEWEFKVKQAIVEQLASWRAQHRHLQSAFHRRSL